MTNLRNTYQTVMISFVVLQMSDNAVQSRKCEYFVCFNLFIFNILIYNHNIL